MQTTWLRHARKQSTWTYNAQTGEVEFWYGRCPVMRQIGSCPILRPFSGILIAWETWGIDNLIQTVCLTHFSAYNRPGGLCCELRKVS
jgi:hypothetical protein